MDPWDEPGGYPLTGQAVSGVEAARARSAALARNVRRRVSIQRVRLIGQARGSVPRSNRRHGVLMRHSLADRPVVVKKLLLPG